ncbi:MAG: flagellar basal body rod modification protein [Alphaproteobacteria bacterium]|nr:MAG: flagellar basal body rod modification protein [Alphaproteobacteria bacterium]
MSSITTATTPAASATATTADAKATPMISSDFQTFLKMLTVQMQNQDPLNPIESTDYAVQLATFSGVEQQVKTNDLLEAVKGQLGAMSMSDLAGWVGKEVRAEAPAWYTGAPVTIQGTPASGAERAVVQVQNAAGETVDRFEIPVSSEPVEWSGRDAAGNRLPDGAYTFTLQSYSHDKLVSEKQMSAFSEVKEARMEDGEVLLVLAGGGEVKASDVDALRLPQTP